MALSTQEKKEHRNELLKIIDNDEAVKDYIVYLNANCNFEYRDIANICGYPNVDYVTCVFLERNIKRCSICKKVKPREEFNGNHLMSDGKKPCCKKCYNYRAKYNKAPKETKRLMDEFIKIVDYEKQIEFIKNLYFQKYTTFGICSITDYSFESVTRILQDHDIKMCSDCREILSRSQYTVNKKNQDGLNHSCQFCIALKKANPDIKDLMLEFRDLPEDQTLNYIFYLCQDLKYSYREISFITRKECSEINTLFTNNRLKRCAYCQDVKSLNVFPECSAYCRECQKFLRLDDVRKELYKEFKVLDTDQDKHNFVFRVFELGYSYKHISTLTEYNIHEIIEILKTFDAKRCFTCLEIKSLDSFVNDNNSIDGKVGICKTCHNQISRENRDQNNNYQRKYIFSPAKFDTFASKIEMYHEVRRDPDNQDSLQVKCKLCNAWFNPTVIDVNNRICAINGVVGSTGTENHLYCSEECKSSCSLYKTHTSEIMTQDRIQAGHFNPEDHRRMQSTLRTFIISQFGTPDHCDKCGDSKDVSELILHHKEPVSIVHIFEADRNNLMWECLECHTASHNIEGCHPYELAELVYC